MEYDNTNTGTLARNDRKTDEKHADFKGTINVEGREFWLDAYVRARKDGTGKFFSLRVKAKEAAPAPPQKPAKPFSDMDSDIPF